MVFVLSRSIGVAVAAAVLALVGVPAQAETLHVQGIYPADSDGAAALNSIAVDTFGGVDGPTASMAIADALRAVRIDGEDYFSVLPEGGGRNADAVLNGSAEAVVQRRSYKESRKKCLVKDSDGKCTKKGTIKERCRRRTVELGASIRLVSDRGRLLYASEAPVSATDNHCLDYKTDPEPVSRIVQSLSVRLADRVRHALAPAERAEDIRVLERRKELPKALQSRFKAAVRATKHDPAAACREWEEIDQASPGNLSVVFNLGLCAESQGQIGEAERFYQEALRISPGAAYPDAGLKRVEERMRADHQLAAHYGA